MKKKKVLRLIRKVLMQEGLIPNPYIYNPTHLISSANPYLYGPHVTNPDWPAPQSSKIADEMKSIMDANREEVVKVMNRLVMGVQDPKGEKQ